MGTEYILLGGPVHTPRDWVSLSMHGPVCMLPSQYISGPPMLYVPEIVGPEAGSVVAYGCFAGRVPMLYQRMLLTYVQEAILQALLDASPWAKLRILANRVSDE